MSEFIANKNLKIKIANTISHYQNKCTVMQEETQQLHNALLQLTQIPSGMHHDLDEHLLFLREALNHEPDVIAIQQCLKSIVAFISSMLTEQQGQLEKLENIKENNAPLLSHSDAAVIPQAVNDKLKELLQYLAVPDELHGKLVFLNTFLEQPLSNTRLIKAMEEIKNLVIHVFNTEQYQFKFFLEHITNQLLNVNNYLKFTFENNRMSQDASNELEQGIQTTLDDIKNDMTVATSLEGLTDHLEKNLQNIGNQIKTYKDTEQHRLHAYEQEIKLLQEKLTQSEQQTQKITEVLGAKIVELNMDSLTQIANRNYYDTYINMAYSRWKNDNGNLILAVADIDLFKQINDQYGHLAGDKVLIKIASILQNSIKMNDFVARYGGEEFVLVFEHASLNEIREIIDGIRKNIETFHFLYQGSRVPVTVSFGLALAKEGDDTTSLFMRADTALYQAKKEGRNRVVC